MAKYRISSKVLLSLYLLSFSVLQEVQSQRWDDIIRWDVANSIYDVAESKESQRLLEDYECNTLGQCDLDKYNKESNKIVDVNEIPLKRIKTNSGLTSLSGLDKLLQMDDSKPGAASGIVPYFHTSVIPLPCSCGAHYRLMDLGRAYLPRYLVTAVCDANACGATGTYRCRQRFYRVRVFKRKDAGNAHPPEREPDQVTNPPLPENLRKTWSFETFTVTVACECGP